MKFKARLFSLWEAVRASYWFVPSTMTIAALLLSLTMVEIDYAAPDSLLQNIPWLYTGTADGARTLLAAIASSMIGVAGVVFSITIVALTLASGQFGPRLLRQFMRDTGNQITLGTFLAAFLYCLLVLRSIQDGKDEGTVAFVPQLSMLVAVLMAVAGLGVLIFFIHHTASSIQAPNVIAAVSAELSEAIETLYPERLGQDTKEEAPTDAPAELPESFERDSAEVCAGQEGYLQRIEPDQLLAITQSHDLIARVDRRPGQFVQSDQVVLRVWPQARAKKSVLAELRETFAVSNQRSLAQDAGFAVEQLVEVAVRALSPGVNDPFTAIQCIDRLAAALSKLAERKLPSSCRYDEEGRLRIVAPPRTFGDFLDTSYNQIRRYGSKSLEVLLRMQDAMDRIAEHVVRPEDRQCLWEHARTVHELSCSAAETDRDREQVHLRFAKIKRKLQIDDEGAASETT